jgi:hypothetical protein
MSISYQIEARHTFARKRDFTTDKKRIDAASRLFRTYVYLLIKSHAWLDTRSGKNAYETAERAIRAIENGESNWACVDIGDDAVYYRVYGREK